MKKISTAFIALILVGCSHGDSPSPIQFDGGRSIDVWFSKPFTAPWDEQLTCVVVGGYSKGGITCYYKKEC